MQVMVLRRTSIDAFNTSMNLFWLAPGFSPNAYYRDILVFCACIGGFAVVVVFAVWIKVRETR